jgi:spermidine/putrescine transport system permease protein
MKKYVRGSYLLLGYAFLYLPLFVLIAGSFFQVAPQTGFTMSWYQSLLQDPNLLTVTGNSLMVAVVAATIATILGTLAAVVLRRYRFMGRQLLSNALFSLIIIPDLVLGISLLLWLHLLHVPLGFLTLVIGHITLCLPFVTIMINSRLLDLDHSLFEAGHDLGASEWRILRHIILPVLLPAIIGAWLMCFTLSTDDVVISFFLTGPSFNVLPLYIYSLVRLGITPEINALCSIIFVVTLVLILIAQWRMRLE